MALIHIRAACCAAWQCVRSVQCAYGSLRAVWSSHATTLNPDRESVFSARLESPIDCSSNETENFEKYEYAPYSYLSGLVFPKHVT